MASHSYEIKPVQKEDTDAVMDLLRRTFYIEEPLNQAAGLYVDGTYKELDEYCVGGLQPGLCFKAVDHEGNVVGVMGSEIYPLKEESENDNLTMAQNCKNPKYQKIFFVLAKIEEDAKIWEKFPNDQQVLYIKLGATDPSWRNRGISKALLKAIENMTRERGIKILRVDTTSAYSAMSVERLGFTCIYSAAYIDMKMDGQPILVPELPHVDHKIYIKIMNV